MTTPTPITSAIPGPETITRAELDNGIVVLAYENFNAQSIVISGSFSAGAIHEAPENGGLANLTAAALMRGTQNRDFDAIHSALEDIGADLGHYAGTHQTGFSGKSLAEDLPTLLDILADSLRHPVFPTEQVERLRGEYLTGLQYREQDTRYRAARGFREALYPQTHPYHHSTRGTLETLPALTPEMLRDFHARHYGPRGMIIVVTGAVEGQAAVDAVRAALGDWRNDDQPETPPLPAIESPPAMRREFAAVPGKTQSDIVLGTLGPSRFDADFQAANLANSILGQFGMMGRVGDVVREQAGMAYYAYSRLEGGFGPGAWSISAGVNPVNIERAIDLCTGELRRLATEPVSAEDLADNQSYFTGRLPLQLESNEGLAGTLHLMENYDLGLDYLHRYKDMIYALTADDLMNAAAHYLNPDALVISIAGPDVKA